MSEQTHILWRSIPGKEYLMFTKEGDISIGYKDDGCRSISIKLAEAAPALLEACKEAASHLDGCSHGYPDELWEQLEEAIANAEGGDE